MNWRHALLPEEEVQRVRVASNQKRALVVIANRPAEGSTKTRLTPPLSGTEAASLYEGFLRDVIATARSVPEVSRLITYWPRTDAGYFKQAAPDFGLIPQVGGDLGERLDNALTRCLSGEFHQAVIVSSDSPTLPAAYLGQAFKLLAEADVVLGPCEDGGYYLIGLTQPQPGLLRGVSMSTPTVLQDTLALAQKEGLQTALLPAWYDVDTVEDLARLAAHLKRLPAEIAPHTRRFFAGTNPALAAADIWAYQHD